MDPGDESSGAERLLIDLSTRFTGLPVERIHEEIERGLQRLAEFLGTDRSTLFQFSPDGTRLSPVASWARPGLEPYTTQIVQAEVPWYHARLVRGETVRFEHLPDDLPDEAVEEKAYTRRLGMQSNLTVPITVGGRPVCALAIGAFRTPRDWPDPLVERVRLVGHIFANALYRQRVETELRATVTALDRHKGELEARLEEIRQLKDQLEEAVTSNRDPARRA
jgi:GAF domain-containing protein